MNSTAVPQSLARWNHIVAQAAERCGSMWGRQSYKAVEDLLERVDAILATAVKE